MTDPAPHAAAEQPRWLNPEELDTWYWFAQVMRRLPTALETQLRRDAKLSYVEYYVLAALSDQPTHRLRLSELAVLTNAELSRLSHLISRLQQRGLVERQVDPEDGRFTQAVLTDQGYAYLTTAAPAHVERVRELVYDVLDPEELANLRTAAKKIIARIDTASPCPPIA